MGTEVAEGFGEEIVKQLRVVVPTAFTYGSTIVISLASFMVLGRFEEIQLAGASFGYTISNLFGIAVTTGLASALDILLTQAHGAQQPRAMRIALQRGMLILSLACCILSVILFNGERILLWLNQEPELSAYAGKMTKWCGLSIWPQTMFDVLKRYYQAMSKLRPALIITFMAILINIGSLFVTVHLFQWGVDGVGASLLMANSFMFFAMLAHYLYHADAESRWQISEEAFQKWHHYMELALPAFVMVFFEMGSFEASVLVISDLGPSAIAQQTILVNAISLMYVLPAGVSAAGVTRVGNLLGAGKAKAASTAAWVAGFVATVSGTFLLLMLIIFRYQWPYLYTNQIRIAEAVVQISPTLALFELCDNVQSTLGAVVKGSGRPLHGAILTAICFWVIGIPLGGVIAYKVDSVIGIWQGFIIGELIITVAYIITLASTNWNEMVDRALQLVAAHEEESPLIANIKLPDTVYVG